MCEFCKQFKRSKIVAEMIENEELNMSDVDDDDYILEFTNSWDLILINRFYQDDGYGYCREIMIPVYCPICGNKLEKE